MEELTAHDKLQTMAKSDINLKKGVSKFKKKNPQQ